MIKNRWQTPAEFLNSLYLERKRRNPACSTRALARDLGMSQALLSLVINGKRAVFLTKGEADEVYQLNVQLFPSSRKNPNN